MRHPSYAAIAFAFIAVSACSKCSCSKEGAPGKAPVELTRHLPRDAELVVVVPDLVKLGGKVSELQSLKLSSFFAQLQGFKTGQDFVTAIMNQVGLDLRSREALEAAGLRPDGGAAFALLKGEQVVSVVAVKDAAKWQETVAKLVESRLGAKDISAKKEGDVVQVTYSRAGVPAVTLLFTEGVSLLAPGSAGAVLPSLISLKPEASMATEPFFLEGRKRLGGTPDAWVFIPPGGAATAGMPEGAVSAVTAAVELSKSAISLKVDFPLPPGSSALAAFTAQQDAPSLVPLLPPEAFLVARFSGEPRQLEGVWPLLAGKPLTRALTASGFDVNSQVLANLLPGAVAAVSLAPSVNLAGGVPQLDVRRTNPFRFVSLAAVAKVKDPAAAEATLAKLPELAPRLGAKIEPVKKGAVQVFQTTYSQGEGTHLALAKDLFVMAAPMTQMEALLARVEAKPQEGGVDASLEKTMEAQALAVVVDLHKLAAAVKALPSSAWGIGGFAIKASTLRWLEATDDLRALTLGVRAVDGSLRAELSLQLAAK